MVREEALEIETFDPDAVFEGGRSLDAEGEAADRKRSQDLSSPDAGRQALLRTVPRLRLAAADLGARDTASQRLRLSYIFTVKCPACGHGRTEGGIASRLAMFKPLAFILRRIVVRGNLTFITCDGIRHTFGNGEGRRVVARFADRRAGTPARARCRSSWLARPTCRAAS